MKNQSVYYAEKVMPQQHTFLTHITYKLLTTTMWVNAQRDGRPAKYRWRPLFNVAKFG